MNGRNNYMDEQKNNNYAEIPDEGYKDNVLYMIDMFCHSEKILQRIKTDYMKNEEFYIKEMKEQYISDIVKRPYITNGDPITAVLCRIVAVYLLSGRKSTQEILFTFSKGYQKFVDCFSKNISVKDYYNTLISKINLSQFDFILPAYVFLTKIYTDKMEILWGDDNTRVLYIKMLAATRDDVCEARNVDELEYKKLGKRFFDDQAGQQLLKNKNARIEASILTFLGDLGIRQTVVKGTSLSQNEFAMIARSKEEYFAPQNKFSKTDLWFFDENDIKQMVTADTLFFTMALYLCKLSHLYNDAKTLAIKCNDRADELQERCLLAENNRKEDIENAIGEFKEKINKLQNKINDMQISYDKLKENSQKRTEELSNKYNDLDGYTKMLEDAAKSYREQITALKEKVNEKEEIYPKGTILWGGPEPWQQRFKEKHPEVTVLSGFDMQKPTSIFNKTVPLVLINTDGMKHGSTYKFMPIIKRLGLNYKYIC